MPGFEVWDIVKVPFPFTNRPVQQFRPALVEIVV
jgi:mRNA interferase MazF